MANCCDHVNSLIVRIQEAFANVPYPGDDRIAEYPGDDDNLISLDFHGKHWRDITIEDIAPRHREGLLWMTAEGFRFYLPAYMIVCMTDPGKADVALDSVVSLLTRESADPFWKTWFEERVNGLSEEQGRAIIGFVKYILERDGPYLERDDIQRVELEKAIAYWTHSVCRNDSCQKAP